MTGRGGALGTVPYCLATARAEQARQNVLTAAQASPAAIVPGVTGMTVADAQALFVKLPLSLNREPSTAPDTGVVQTNPPARSVARAGVTVTIQT